MHTFSLRWQTWMARQSRPRASEPPLRDELFSVEQLARHARAQRHAAFFLEHEDVADQAEHFAGGPVVRHVPAQCPLPIQPAAACTCSFKGVLMIR